MKYCEFCGKELKDTEVCTCPEALEKGKKSKKTYMLGASMFISIFAIFVVIGLLTRTSKIDPFEYMKVSFEGYDTKGNVELHFDEESLITKFLGEAPDKSNFQEYFEWDERYTSYSNDIEISCSKKEGLSNNDEVTVTVTVSGEAAYSVENGSKSYIVEGLPEIELVDVFAEYKIKFSGADGESEVEFYTDSSDEFIKACRFSIDPREDFSNNDTIKVTITNEDNLGETYQKLPLETSKEYKVSNLGSYITDVSQIPTAELEALAGAFLKEEQESHVDNDTVTYKNLKLEGSYFLKERSGIYRHPYEIWIVVSCDRYMRGEFDDTLYYPLKFEAPILQADGTLGYDLEDGSSSSFLTGETFPTESITEDYIVTKIK